MDKRSTCEALGCDKEVDYFVTFEEDYLGATLRAKSPPPWGLSVPEDSKEGMVLCYDCLGTFQNLTLNVRRIDDLERFIYKRTIREALEEDENSP